MKGTNKSGLCSHFFNQIAASTGQASAAGLPGHRWMIVGCWADAREIVAMRRIKREKCLTGFIVVAILRVRITFVNGLNE